MKKIILVNLLGVLGIVLLGFLVMKFQLVGSKQGSENVNNSNSEEDIIWSEYVSDNNVFKISYPSDWEILNDKNFIFSIKAKQSDAVIRIKKILATDKKELQTALDQEYKNCVEQKDAVNCSSVNIEDLKLIKISGEISRINQENKYLSGTSIYIYAKDYYLEVYTEYEDPSLLAKVEKIIDSIYLSVESKYKHYYCNRELGAVPIMTDKARFTAYCHKVEEGDTLWSIAEKYYGDPHLWGQLKIYDDKDNYDLARLSPDDPKALSSGTELVLWSFFQFSHDERTAGGVTEGWGLDTDTGDLFTTNRETVYINNDIYDKGFNFLASFFIDEKTNNKIYIITPKREDGESRSDQSKFQFVFNRQRNTYIGPGANFELLTFNHDEDKYVVRTNVKQDVPDPGFMALSNIGNGPEYDYLDSFIWYDNDTLVYRAQNDDQWRIVINNKDYKIYGYLENLRLEDGLIKFDARNERGRWTQEEISIEDDSYNAELVSIPDVPPVGEEFFAYLKNTRSDLSEAELFKIEKNYHYKTGTLVDEFGNLIEDPVEIYLDPVAGVGMREDIGRLTFTAKNGFFELFAKEIGPYVLSFKDSWSAEELETINPVDFRYSNADYKLTVSNTEYDKKAKAKYIQLAGSGDTLWTVAKKYYGQGYYWPLVAENNDLDYSKGMPEIADGDELYIFPFSDFHQDQLNDLRKKYHEENNEEIFTVNNEQYSYSIDYPACWTIIDPVDKEYNENEAYYNGYIHRQSIMGPQTAQNPRGTRQAVVNIEVYDNRNKMSLEDYALYRKITEQSIIDQGDFSAQEQANGGFLITGGYYNELKHLIFFKGNLIYDIAYKEHDSIDDISRQETLDIIDSFVIED